MWLIQQQNELRYMCFHTNTYLHCYFNPSSFLEYGLYSPSFYCWYSHSIADIALRTSYLTKQPAKHIFYFSSHSSVQDDCTATPFQRICSTTSDLTSNLCNKTVSNLGLVWSTIKQEELSINSKRAWRNQKLLYM